MLYKNINIVRLKYITKYKMNCHNKFDSKSLPFRINDLNGGRFLFLISMAKIYYIISLRTWQ